MSSRRKLQYFCLSVILFSTDGCLTAQLVESQGVATLFYRSPGAIVVILAYMFYQAFFVNRKCWTDQNLMKEKKLDWLNFLGYVACCCLNMLAQILMMLTLFFGNISNINSGIIFLFFTVYPLILALLALNTEILEYYHGLALILTIISGILVSVNH